MPGEGLELGEMFTEPKQVSQGLLVSDSSLLICSVPTPQAQPRTLPSHHKGRESPWCSAPTAF